MGNHHSTTHAHIKPRKNVHWKSAGRPAVPGKPEIIPILSDEEPNAITLKWAACGHDGGAPLQGYQVECNRLGSADWVRTAPPVVLRPELLLTGLEPPHRYQFRVAAINGVGRSDYSELSDVLTVSSERGPHDPPVFLQHLEDVTTLENDKTEFRVTFTGAPPPTIAWFKDDYEIFSSRRTAITTNESSSVLVFHQTLPSDEGEVKCTATNRAGHAVTRAKLALEAAPKLRYPRQYEDGLLYEINETIFLKTSIVGKPTPVIEWRHDGQVIATNSRVEISNTPKYSMLKIHSAQRSDRGEYQIHAKNSIGEDTAAFLVTVTAPPEPPRRVAVARQVDKSVTLDWEPPEDDGGCRIGNYVVEYYRSGWNVWLKATTSRKTNVTLFDLIEGSEYRFRVKAESPYGMSAPSVESAPVRIPGRPVDSEFLETESRIINEMMLKEDGEEARVSPVPRRKRAVPPAVPPAGAAAGAPNGPPPRRARSSPPPENNDNEFMLVLYPDSDKVPDKAENRKSFQLDLKDALSPPPISFSAPDLSARCVLPFRALRNAVSSTELLHEKAMARFYKAVAMKEEQSKNDQHTIHENDIPRTINAKTPNNNQNIEPTKSPNTNSNKTEIFIKTDSIENKEFKYGSRQTSQESALSQNYGKWQHMSFDEDYTASTVSSDEEEYSDGGSLNGDVDRSQYSNEELTYNPRDKIAQKLPSMEPTDEEDISEKEPLKVLPLPDPNFIPKPILKRREQDVVTPEIRSIEISKQEPIQTKKVIDSKKPKKKETIFRKITKMPLQKPHFGFPKLGLKKEAEKFPEEVQDITPKTPSKQEMMDDKYDDPGRTVIEHYGNIVKEYGSQKRPTTPLYLKTEDLKTVAEKQELEVKEKHTEKKKVLKKKKPSATSSNAEKKLLDKDKLIQNNNIKSKPKVSNAVVAENKGTNKVSKLSNNPEKSVEKFTQQVVLKTTERATIIIPINYHELEKKAKVNVRSAIDYTVDMCLLLLAFWVYFFKDERLAIPFLSLIIYRQVQETLFFNIPEWIRSHTPSWFKKKNS